MAERKSTATMEIAIGATLIAAVVILMVMLFAWGNSSTFLSKHYWVVVMMQNVGGLREGAPVKIGGFQIGKVSSIQLRPGSTDLDIALSIEESRLLPKGSTAKISTAGLVGDAFLEIIPGKSNETIKRATTLADAERISSYPVPDFSELLVQVNSLGEKLNFLTSYINDVLGDEQFRKNIKAIASNLDSVSFEANLILQRGQRVVDNIERTSHNVANLSDSLKSDIEATTNKVVQIVDKISGIADNITGITASVGEVADKAKGVMGNLDGGISDVRRAVNTTIGDPQFGQNLSSTIKNLNEITATISAKRPEIDKLMSNLNTISDDLKATGGNIRAITGGIDPSQISVVVNSLSGAIASVTEAVEKIKEDPVLALSINKAADRIVKMKFDEMSKNPQFRSADQSLLEIQRWTREALNRGHYIDPTYSQDRRPYVMDK